MDNLHLLLSLCKCGVFITVNEHRDYCETVDYYFNHRTAGEDLEIENDIMDKMVELDTIVHIQFYPITPIGSYEIYHYDIDIALQLCVKTLQAKGIKVI